MRKLLSVYGRMGACRTPSVAWFLCLAHTPLTEGQRLYAHGTLVPRPVS